MAELAPDRPGRPMRLNLGCGGKAEPGYTNVDLVKQDGVDIVCDLDIAPWPFLDNSVELILARDVFEHVHNAITFMTECHRVLKPGARLQIRTPHVSSLDAFTDPTHRRFPTEYTFDYWVSGTRYYTEHNAAYGAVSFRKDRLIVTGGAMHVTLRKEAAMVKSSRVGQDDPAGQGRRSHSVTDRQARVKDLAAQTDAALADLDSQEAAAEVQRQADAARRQ